MKVFDIFPDRSTVVQNESIAISKLTVLLGPNGSGKSTILRSIGQCLTSSTPAGDRSAEGEPILLIDPEFVEISILRLAAVRLVGMDNLSQVRYSEWIDDQEAERPWMPEFMDESIDWANDPAQDVLLFQETIAFHFFKAEPLEVCQEQLRNVARHVARNTAVCMCAGQIGLAVRMEHFEEIIPDILELEEHGFELNRKSPAASESPLRELIAVMSQSTREFEWLLEPLVDLRNQVKLVHEPEEDLNAEAREDLYSLHLEYDEHEFFVEIQLAITKVAQRIYLDNLFGNSYSSGHFSEEVQQHLDSMATWLTEVASPAQTEGPIVEVFDPDVKLAIGLVNEFSEDCIPTFLKEEGQFKLKLLPLSQWIIGQSRVDLVLHHFGRETSIRNCSSGVARYAALAFRLAAELTLRAERGELKYEWLTRESNTGVQLQFNQEVESEIPNVKMMPSAIAKLIGGLPDQTQSVLAGRFGLGDGVPFDTKTGKQIDLSTWKRYRIQSMNVVLLLDEPEVHLHPMAIRSVSEWILKIEPLFLAVVIATHNPTIASIDLPVSQVYLAERETNGSRFHRRGENASRDRHLLRDQLGMTEGELLLELRYFLFVEGIHDKIVLSVFFGEEFKDAGIQLVNLQGLGKARYLTTTDFIWEFKKPIGVFADNFDSQKNLSKGSGPKTGEEGVMKSIIKQFENANRTFDRYGHLLKDLLFQLDPLVVRNFANEQFTTWQDAYVAALEAGATDDWKGFIKSTYGLNITGEGSLEFIEGLALEVRRQGLIPSGLQEFKTQLIARAISLSWGDPAV